MRKRENNYRGIIPIILSSKIRVVVRAIVTAKAVVAIIAIPIEVAVKETIVEEVEKVIAKDWGNLLPLTCFKLLLDPRKRALKTSKNFV